MPTKNLKVSATRFEEFSFIFFSLLLAQSTNTNRNMAHIEKSRASTIFIALVLALLFFFASIKTVCLISCIFALMQIGIHTKTKKKKVISPIFKLKLIFLKNTHTQLMTWRTSPKISSQQQFGCFAASTSNHQSLRYRLQICLLYL